MTSKGRILLADDEETFALSTAELLRAAGFECDTAPDGATALERARDGGYDLLISDLEMPGNSDLDLVRRLADTVGGLPVIILTGYPSLASAVAAIDLPVAAYLVKPVEFSKLLSRIESAVDRYRSYRVVHAAEERLRGWRDEVARLTPAEPSVRPVAPSGHADAFLALTLRNVMGSLRDLEQLSRALVRDNTETTACQLLNCPRGVALQQALEETVTVLNETKTAFKSKLLGDLRRRLEGVLGQTSSAAT